MKLGTFEISLTIIFVSVLTYTNLPSILAGFVTPFYQAYFVERVTEQIQKVAGGKAACLIIPYPYKDVGGNVRREWVVADSAAEIDLQHILENGLKEKIHFWHWRETDRHFGLLVDEKLFNWSFRLQSFFEIVYPGPSYVAESLKNSYITYERYGASISWPTRFSYLDFYCPHLMEGS